MKTNNLKQRFLVLVPHFDARTELRKYSENLHKIVPAGTYTFPWVVPLMVLSKPLSADELKETAKLIKKTVIQAGGKNGKFISNEAGIMPFPVGTGTMMLFGSKLNFKSEAVSSVIAGSFLLRSEIAAKNLPLPPEISFRAAALANMDWQPVDGAFEYTIGPLTWLPKNLPDQVY